jgi:uncharacterized protein YdhG (YjbR/CyaY superfamily)
LTVISRKKPATIAAYIKAAPAAGQPHLRKLHKILKGAAPGATEEIKWGMPFFVEPRFLFAFSAYKAHLSFAPFQSVLEAFAKELKGHDTTKNMLKVRYDEPLPEALIRKMAQRCVREVSKRADDNFW